MQLGDLSTQDVDFVGMGVLQEGDFRFLHALQFLSKVVEFQIGDVLVLYQLLLQLIVLFLQQLDGVLEMVPHFGLLQHGLLQLHVLRVYDFFQLRILVVEGFDLIQVLFLKIFYFRVEVIIELTLQGLNFLPVLSLLELQITSESLFLFPELANFEVSLLADSGYLHLEITDFVVLLIDELLQLSDFQLVFLSIAQIISLQVLDLQVLLIFYLIDL